MPTITWSISSMFDRTFLSSYCSVDGIVIGIMYPPLCQSGEIIRQPYNWNVCFSYTIDSIISDTARSSMVTTGWVHPSLSRLKCVCFGYSIDGIAIGNTWHSFTTIEYLASLMFEWTVLSWPCYRRHLHGLCAIFRPSGTRSTYWKWSRSGWFFCRLDAINLSLMWPDPIKFDRLHKSECPTWVTANGMQR